jgi:hypothetical protein
VNLNLRYHFEGMVIITLLLSGLLCSSTSIPTPSTSFSGACEPAGVYYVNRDMVTRSDPITMNTTSSTQHHCPKGATQSFVASTLKYWKGYAVCQYANGSLWKQDGQTAVVKGGGGPRGSGASSRLSDEGCAAIEWQDPPPNTHRFLWCREDATKEECTPIPAPPPPPPPAPPPPPPFAMYDPVPPTAVYFTSTDTALQGMVAHAASLAPLNIKPFRRLSVRSSF